MEQIDRTVRSTLVNASVCVTYLDSKLNILLRPLALRGRALSSSASKYILTKPVPCLHTNSMSIYKQCAVEPV